MDIKDEIKAEMKRQKVTYAELARRMNESRMNVWIKLTRDGNPNYKSLVKMCEALNMELCIRRKKRNTE